MKATEQWTRALAAWAIPPRILAAAPESPWGYLTHLFAHKADTLPADPTPSARRALEELPPGGSVLDVGCGAGAGALPLAARAAALIGVDPSAEMLRAFYARAEATGKAVTTIEGTWPAAAEEWVAPRTRSSTASGAMPWGMRATSALANIRLAPGSDSTGRYLESITPRLSRGGVYDGPALGREVISDLDVL